LISRVNQFNKAKLGNNHKVFKPTGYFLTCKPFIKKILIFEGLMPKAYFYSRKIFVMQNSPDKDTLVNFLAKVSLFSKAETSVLNHLAD
jgi:hypothetical protein